MYQQSTMDSKREKIPCRFRGLKCIRERVHRVVHRVPCDRRAYFVPNNVVFWLFHVKCQMFRMWSASASSPFFVKRSLTTILRSSSPNQYYKQIQKLTEFLTYKSTTSSLCRDLLGSISLAVGGWSLTLREGGIRS